jgi:predicted phage tail protein
MRNIYLHGAIAQKYGDHFKLDIATAGEAIRALCANFPEFVKSIHDGSWHIVRGKSVETGMDLNEHQVAGFKLGSGDLHILPYVAGSKNGGLLKTIAGIALIGISFGFAGALAAPISTALLGNVTWGSAIGMIGLSLTLNGVSQLLAGEKEETKDENSFLLSGTSDSGKEGTGVPLIYGEVITGGIIASSGLDIEQIGSNTLVQIPASTESVITEIFGEEFVFHSGSDI